MRLAIVLLIFVIVIAAIALIRTMRARGGSHRAPDDRDRPMKPWADEPAERDEYEDEDPPSSIRW